MSTSNEKAVKELNALIEICIDGQNGFQSASEGVKDSVLQGTLAQLSTERAQFAEELQREVAALGGKPQTSGTAAGALHRGWMDIKTALTKNDDHAVLVECERGEDAAKAAYEKAVKGNGIPGNMLAIVEKQYAKVREAHDQIKALRDSVPVAR